MTVAAKEPWLHAAMTPTTIARRLIREELLLLTATYSSHNASWLLTIALILAADACRAGSLGENWLLEDTHVVW